VALPRDVILDEVQQIVDLGIEVRYNTEVGKDITLKELSDTYDAVVISAGLPDRLVARRARARTRWGGVSVSSFSRT
jgi:NADPH-dependent glutamate synthase beta subunit-like oxidoreductase